MHQVERTGRRKYWHRPLQTQIERQLTQCKHLCVDGESLEACFELDPIDSLFSRQANEISVGFEKEQDARKERTSGHLFAQSATAFLIEQGRQVGRSVEI